MSKLGVKLPNDFFDWNSDKIRCFLLMRAAGFRRLILRMRKKHRIKTLNSKTRREKIEKKTVWFTFPDNKLTYEVDDLCRWLLIPNSFFIWNCLINMKSIDNRDLDELSLPVLIGNSSLPQWNGFFVKVNPYTTNETLERAKQYIHTRLYPPLKEKADKQQYFDSPVQRDVKADESSYRFYIRAEQSIYNELRRRGRKDKKTGREYKTTAIVTSAIKTVCLEKHDPDFTGKYTLNTLPRNLYENEKKRYDRIRKKYNIPSFTEFYKWQPFIWKHTKLKSVPRKFNEEIGDALPKKTLKILLEDT